MMPEPILPTSDLRTANQILADVERLYQELRTARGERKTAIEAEIADLSARYKALVPRTIVIACHRHASGDTSPHPFRRV
jgi:hypothetical protein